MDDEKEEGPGPLSSVSDEQPHPSTSQDEPQQPTQNTYWLAQYFTRGRYDQGMTVMAVKYPLHWPREKVDKAAQDVRNGDKFAMKDLPLVIKQVTSTTAPPPPS